MNQFIPYFLGQAPAPFPRAVTVAEVLAHQRHRERRPRRPAPDVLRDARELLVRRLLQGRGDRVGARADHRGVRHRPRPAVGHGLRRRRRGGRGLGRPGGHRARAHRASRQARRGRRARELLAHPRRRARRARARRSSSTAGRAYGPDGGPDVDEERFMEIWNLVFIQDQVDGDARGRGAAARRRTSTPVRSLERVAIVLQGVDNVFETDLFSPTARGRRVALGQAPRRGPNDDDVSLKIVAEHGRATTFLIADGVQPSNEGRGYILRRMLRRVGLARAPARHRGPRARARSITHGGRAVRRRLPGAPRERGVRAAGGRLRGGAVLGDPAAGAACCSRRRKGRRRGSRISGDDAFKLSDTFGFPLRADRGAGGRGRARRSTSTGSPSCWRSSATARARRAKKVEVGLDAGAVPPTEFVGYQRARGRGADRAAARRRDPTSSRSPRRARRCACSSTARRSTRRAAARSATRASIRTDTGVVRVTDAQCGRAGTRSMHVGHRRVRARSAPGQEAHAAGRREPP